MQLVHAWVHSFVPPKRSSAATMDYLEGRSHVFYDSIKLATLYIHCISKLHVLYNHFRTEILQAIYSQVIQNTEYPTSAEYIAVAKKVVDAYPRLKDHSETPWVEISLYHITHDV